MYNTNLKRKTVLKEIAIKREKIKANFTIICSSNLKKAILAVGFEHFSVSENKYLPKPLAINGKIGDNIAL